ncbi:unnamed protein product [Ceratitis capitata]|uniref:(Mediterranean fruit fly) hypothetical protein n=1 Tax=Ceratitis capitata TaxID=7213 RepID=A0A811VJA9_CERCA|nr:unnamed protein product [Ceratitis capitata]
MAGGIDIKPLEVSSGTDSQQFFKDNFSGAILLHEDSHIHSQSYGLHQYHHKYFDQRHAFHKPVENSKRAGGDNENKSNSFDIDNFREFPEQCFHTDKKNL